MELTRTRVKQYRKDKARKEESQIIQKEEQMKREVKPSVSFDPAVDGGSDDDDDDDSGDHYGGSFSFHPIESSYSPSKQTLHGTHLRGWGSVDHFDSRNSSGKRTWGLDDAALISAIDQKMKEHADVLLHAVERLSARVSQMESRTRKLESSMDDLRVTVEFNHGNVGRKLKELETVLMEVHCGIKDIRDKQDIAEVQLKLSKLNVFRADLKSGSDDHVQISKIPSSSAPLPSHQPSPVQISSSQQIFPLPSTRQPQMMMTSPPLFNTSTQTMVMETAPYFPSQPPENLFRPLPHQDSYYQLPVPTSVSTNFQPYNASSTSLPQLTPHVHQPYQPQLPHSSNYIQLPETNPPFSSTNPRVQYPLGRAPEEAHYPLPHGIQTPPQLHGWSPHSSQYNVSYLPNVLDQTTNKQYPTPQAQLLQHQAHGRAAVSFQDNSFSAQGSGPTMIPGDDGTSLQLPLAHALPLAIPTAATDLDAESSSYIPRTRVPIDVVVDNVVAMGFRRDLVKATVKNLTENGQSVDLNVVLDKLMNNG